MKRTVLVVDDEKDIRDAFKTILETEGYRVLTASSGKACLDVLKKEKKVCLVILDILMPKMTGITCLKKIRELYPTLKVLIVTVVGGEETQDKAVRLGIEGYLIKPVGKESLLQTVGDVLCEV